MNEKTRESLHRALEDVRNCSKVTMSLIRDGADEAKIAMSLLLMTDTFEVLSNIVSKMAESLDN